ncbi:zinc finger protein 708-like [Folsomia candida]|uniref:zinc finger protein 708-like n=1 Tax=Folsomia candida TaxID=158441 RepID=UPI0016050E17|nr:zinc finger protein 708-like [Folsomia candida]
MNTQRGNSLVCPTCSKTCTTKQNLNHHMVTHDADAKVKCKICGKILKNPLTLSAHIKMVHTDRVRTSCDICHRVGSTPWNLRLHLATAHSTEERPRFPCGFLDCDRSYLTKGDLSKHIRAEHAENPVRFPCTLCGKEFKSRQNLTTHIATHTTEKAHTCSTCGRGFGDWAAMKRHEVTHLEKCTRKIFKCELCPQTSSSRGNLRTHVQSVHEKQRNHPFAFCDKRFSTLINMRTHVERTHPTNTVKIRSCDKSEYKSHSKVNFARHEKRHNSTNRRECYFCGRQLVSFTNLVKHFRFHTLEQC